MAHDHHNHPPSHGSLGDAIAAGHPSADAEYAFTPPGAEYEHTDASVWIIVKFGLWLVVSAVVIHFGVWLVFGLMVSSREGATPEFPLAEGQERRLPAEPRLQAIPVNDAYQFRLQEDAVLKNYGWIDRAGGRVQIPIDQAMRLTVERGLPSRVQPADATSGVATGQLPADSSSGRTMGRR
jgi:hypothetical protein